MTTLYLCHPASLDHAMPAGHPERPDRIRAIERALEDERFSPLVREQAPRADLAAAALVHPQAFVDAIAEAAPREGMVAIDGDTVMSPGTLEAVLRAVGGAMHAVDEVMSGRVANAFSAMRPPGHHAERTRAMGFCLFNSAAIAARHAQKAHGAERVALVDWDVHHGNGSQDIFWDDRSVLYCSTHQMPLYPGTGATSERGEHDTIVNVPLRPGDDGERFREAFEHGVLPRIDAFAPDLILISAGFDAHWRDPLANLQLTEADFGWATRRLMDLADRHAGGRVVSVLEGGYDLDGLARSVVAHVEALMGR
ncbi:histone deacetylase family protein [Methylobacterium isbiliense]|jgi:acetoin utilization deacetylase AcuC-like enzyme|uniref:Histone deacetylase-like amidohydrolase n=1 Tax=Methylobacterium isbiliense TaxID=315478 RepID=A0ABQ4S6Q5_9HYPH|nr:histone deacetylase family protein [Methylobacterium isbiliense]MDN3624994.1 histone deacetylase family protein [Methylobacterium isbiliense]GJD98871.1 Histone deacetylase-like amidohydrolase [Methylobacterium isbiliense]